LKNKAAALLLAFGLLATTARAELLKLSLLEKPARHFTFRIDIFRDAAAANPAPTATAAAPAQAETLQRTIAEEIAQSVTYEGFILKNAKHLALLNVSGEFYSVGEGDTVLDKIKILKITKDKVTIEYDGLPYEIPIKGGQNG
jgi:hypothetical protein